MDNDEHDDHDRLRSICDGLRRGLARAEREPLPTRLEELLRALRSKELVPEHSHGAKSQVPASQ
jgi:hypothetical protein